MSNPDITITKHGTVYAGGDAVGLFRARIVASGLRLYARTGLQPSRSFTPTAMLAAAKTITGKGYARGAYLRAADDLDLWASTMQSALSVEVRP